MNENCSVLSPWNRRSLVANWLFVDDQIVGELNVLISVESIHIWNHFLDLFSHKEMKLTLEEHYMLSSLTQTHQTIPWLLGLWWFKEPVNQQGCYLPNNPKYSILSSSGMMTVLNDRSVGNHGFWRLMIDHENRWSIIFRSWNMQTLS